MQIFKIGDDFEHVQCVQDTTGTPPDSVHFDHCSCWNSIKRTKCTLGLHTVAMGVGSVLSLKYTRVEKCGQRGILGKYCIHFHMNQKCQDCKAVGNAVDDYNYFSKILKIPYVLIQFR